MKLCIFDLEGTIFRVDRLLSDGGVAGSAWTLVADRLGPEALREDKRVKGLWRQGRLKGYAEWVLETIAIHERFGLDRFRFEEVIGSIPYFDGVAETVRGLREAGVQIAVVSGGLKALADRVGLDHGIHHCFAAAEYFWGSDGSLKHWNVLPTDFSNKQKIVELLCEDVGVEPEECAFVGDGENDTTVARFVGTSVAFNPHAALKDCCTHVVEQPLGEEDLRAVLPFLLGTGGTP